MKLYPITIYNLLISVLLTCISTALYAQENSNPAQLAKDSSGSVLGKPMVKSAFKLATTEMEAGLEDYIKVTISNPSSFYKNEEDYNKRVVLFFNGIPMKGIYAEFTTPGDSTMLFKLTRDTVSLRAWNIFYQAKMLNYKSQVAVSVGFVNGRAIDTEVTDFNLILVRNNLLMFALMAILCLLVLFIILVRKTGIIRDDGLLEHKGSYSLSRSQLSLWTFIIVFSFIYIWIVTGELPPVTGSTLVLLMVSMTTTAGAKMIDSSKDEYHGHNEESHGFFKDILSDHNGVSIHRFQMVIWTLLLGVFFLRAVLKNLAMPQFDENLIILMGVSSGTYLGLKIPEKRLPQTDTPAPDVHEEAQAAG
jgi:hypothetical protein